MVLISPDLLLTYTLLIIAPARIVLCSDSSEPRCADVESRSGAFHSHDSAEFSPESLITSQRSHSTIHCGILCKKFDCKRFAFNEDSMMCHLYSDSNQASTALSPTHARASGLLIYSDDTEYVKYMGDIDNHCIDGSRCSPSTGGDCSDLAAGPTPWKCVNSGSDKCVCRKDTGQSATCLPDCVNLIGNLSEAQRIVIPKLFSVDAVEFKGTSYIAASMINGSANNTEPKIYRYDDSQNEYILHQTLDTSGYSRDSRFFVLDDALYLWQPIHYNYTSGNHRTDSVVHKLNTQNGNFEHYQGISSNGVFGGCAGRRSNGEFWLAESYYHFYTESGRYYMNLYTYKWDSQALEFGPNIPTTESMKEPWGCEFDEIDGEWYVFGSSTRDGGSGSAAVFKLDDVTGAWTTLRQYGSPMYDMHPLSYKGVHYLVTGSSARIVLNRFDTTTKSYEYLQAIILSIKVYDIDSFVYGGDLFVIAALEGENVPSKIYRFDLDQNELLHFLDTQPMNSVFKNVPFKRKGKQYIISVMHQGQEAENATMIVHQFI